MDHIKSIIEESVSVKNKILANQKMLEDIDTLTNATVAALKNGNRVYFCGNGGSAADAQQRADYRTRAQPLTLRPRGRMTM